MLIAGGSPGLTGAPCLAALAAARAGAGYVTVCVPASLSLIFEARLLEAMTLALPDEEGAHAPAGVQPLLAAAGRVSASARSCLARALGAARTPTAFARAVLAGAELPVVLDADGLNVYAGDIDSLRGHATVLTPHAGELGRLLGSGGGRIAAARLRCAREAAERAQRCRRAEGRRHARCRPRRPGCGESRRDAGAGDRRDRATCLPG